MISRIVEVVFPIFFIVLGGFFYGRKHRPDMLAANRLNMNVFLPALIFSALAGRSFNLVDNLPCLLGSLFIVLGSGVMAWPVARMLGYSPRALVPSVMFSNVGNMGLPLLLLAFGNEALGPAVVILVAVTFLQFSLSPWIIDGRSPIASLWREPLLIAAMAGVAVSLLEITLWSPLMTACKLVGDISVGLMIFALGVRLSASTLGAWRVGVVGAVLTPISGLVMAWLLCSVVEMAKEVQDILFVFSALPPAVTNFIFAERFNQEPEKVASIVAIGNAASLFFIPLALALRL